MLALLISAAVTTIANGQDFVRSDCNADGLIDLGDAIQLLDHLFASAPIDCSDACDVNDDGLIDIADAIASLSFLFSLGAPPAAPFPDCGSDPTADVLGCDSFSPCPSGSISHATDIQPIWNANCIGCHVPGGVGVLFGGLDLSGNAFDDLVGVASGQSPLLRVQAGSPNDSYLWHKLNGTQASVGGTGGSMPAGVMATPLDPATLALIEQWILQGANP